MYIIMYYIGINVYYNVLYTCIWLLYMYTLPYLSFVMIIILFLFVIYDPMFNKYN